VRRQSEAATAFLLIQFRPLTPKRRRALLAAALYILAMDALGVSKVARAASVEDGASSCLKVLSRNVVEVIGNNTTKEN
jgi:hypothetical protein